METAQRNRSTDRIGGEARHHTFARTQAKDIATTGVSSKFLMQSLKPKRNQVLESNKDFQDLGFDKEEVLEYLNESVKTFARLRNIEYKPIKARGFTKNLKMMYDFVKRNIPADRILNIDYVWQEGKFMFFESERLDFPNSEVFFMPVACLDYYEGALRELLLRMFCNLRYTQGFEFPHEHWDFMYSLGLMEEDEVYEDYSEDYYESFKSYREGGHIYSLFKEIESYRDDKARYTDVNITNQLVNRSRSEISLNTGIKNKEEVLQCIEEGLLLMREGRLDALDYDPSISLLGNFDNDYQGEKMLIARLCCLTCGTEDNDPIVESAMEVLNSDAGNYCEFAMYDVHVLKPEDTEVWTPNTYPTRFVEWYRRMYNLIDLDEPRIYGKQADRVAV